MAKLCLNGRFLMRPQTGVDRVAAELVQALLEQGLTQGFGGFEIIRPAGPLASVPATARALQTMARPTPAPFGDQAWEQIGLASLDRDTWLLSLCNMGPVLRKQQVVMMHDAQVFRQPEAYSRPFRDWYQTVQPRLGHRSAVVLTVSEHSRRELEHFGVVPPGKAHVIPNGADHILRAEPQPDILTRHDLHPKGYFLFIGSLAPHKNLRMLIEASGLRKRGDVPLVIAGGGNASVFRDAGIATSASVRLIGRVGDGELRSLYENATALVFPSLTEGFGLPAAEAMMCGCPVIASNAGAIPETCGNAAVLVDPNDPNAWSAAMDEIEVDARSQEDLSARGRDHIAEFTWKAAAAHLSAHLKDALRIA